MLELVDLGERLAKRERLAAARRGLTGGKDLDEGPPQPRGDGLGESRLARPGRPEQDDPTRRLNAVLLRQVRIDQRQHDPPLDELLLVLHAREGLPQPSGQHPAAELSEEPDLLGLQWHDPLEVRQVTLLVAAVAKRLHAGLPSASSADNRCTPPPIRRFSSAVSIALPNPWPRQSFAKRQQDDPAAIPADTRGRRADHDLTDDRDDREPPSRMAASTSAKP